VDLLEVVVADQDRVGTEVAGAAVPAIWSSTEMRRPEPRIVRPLATTG
jgi:hypothetical protein